MAKGKMKIRGITIEIGGDTSKLEKSLRDVNGEIRDTQSQLRDVNRLLKLDPSNTELLRQKQKLLGDAVQETSNKLDLLKQTEKDVQAQFQKGEISERQYNALKREIMATEEALKGLEDQAGKSSVALEKISQAGDSVKEAGEKITAAGQKLLPATAAIAGAGAASVSSADDMRSAVNTYLTATGEMADGTEEAAETAEQLEEVLGNIYKGNYGESLEDVAQAAATVKKNMRDIPADGLQKATESAIALRDIFGYDISETTRAAGTLMNQFGISADEAFNLIAQGAQNGLDYSGELIDSINEYSVQFKKVGLNAEDMFNIFAVGADNGAFNLDKIGDAIKEFSIRVVDGSDTTKAGFEAAGLDAEEMSEKFAAGGEVAQEAFQETIRALKSIEDPLERNTAGVNLFGTMWEDLGETVILSMGDAEKSIDAATDSMEKLKKQKYDDLKNEFAQIGREIRTDVVIPLGEDLIPIIKESLQWIKQLVAGFSELSPEGRKVVLVVGAISAAAGPLLISIGQITTGVGALMSGVKMLTPMLTALSGPGGVILLTVATAGALAAKFISLERETRSYYEAARTLTEQEQANKETVEELYNAYGQMEEQRKSGIRNAEAEAIQQRKLFEELQNITDENGKIKTGYEERAAVITGELSNALGIEIGMVDNTIQGYKELAQNIEHLILLKRANAVLTANEGAYAEALSSQASAGAEYYKTMSEIQEVEQSLAAERQRMAEIGQQITQTIKESNATGVDATYQLQELQKQHNEAAASVKGYEEKLDGLNGTLEEAEKTYTGYNAIIQNYEGLSSAIVEGDANKIEEAITALTYNFQTAKTANREILEQQVRDYEEQYEELMKAVEAGAPPVVEEQAKQMKELVDRSREELNKLPSAIAEAGNKGVEAAKQVNPDYREAGKESTKEYSDGITENNDIAEEAGRQVAGAVGVGIQSVNSQARVWGIDMMNGYVFGIRSRISTLENACKDVSGTVYDYLHFSRPEKGPLRNYATWMPDMMKGLAAGIKGSLGVVKNAASQAAGGIGAGLAEGLSESIRTNREYIEKSEEDISEAILRAAQEKLDNYKVYNDLTLSDEEKFWDAVRRQTTEGTQARIDADEKYFDTKKNLNEKMADAEEDYAEKIADAYENLNDKIQDLNKEYEDAVENRTDAIAGAYGLFDEFNIDTDLTRDDLLNNLQGQVDGLEQWMDNLDNLANRGVGEDLLSELQNLGPQSAAQVQLLTEMTDEELDEYVNLFRRKNRLARSQALDELRPMQNDIAQQIEELKAQTQEELAQYQEEYISAMEQLGVALNMPAEEIKLQMAQNAVNMVAELAQSIENEAGSPENTDRFKAIADNILNSTDTLGMDLLQVGQYAMLSLLYGLQSREAQLCDAAKNIAAKIAKTMQSTLQMNLGTEFTGVTDDGSYYIREEEDTSGHELENIAGMLRSYLPGIAQQKYITIDKKAIVGQTAGEMDRQLGNAQLLKGRIG